MDRKNFNRLKPGLPILLGIILAGCSGMNGSTTPVGGGVSPGNDIPQSSSQLKNQSTFLTPDASGTNVSLVQNLTACKPTNVHTTSVTCSLPHAAVSGDLIVVTGVFSANDGAKTIGAANGFSAEPLTTYQNTQAQAFYKFAGSGESNSYTFSASGLGDYMNFAIAEANNVSTSGPVYATSAITGLSSSGASSATNISGAPAGSLGVAFLGPNSGSVINPSSGWNLALNIASSWHAYFGYTLASFPSSATGFKASVSDATAGTLLVLAPATGGPQPTPTPGPPGTGFEGGTPTGPEQIAGCTVGVAGDAANTDISNAPVDPNSKAMLQSVVDEGAGATGFYIPNVTVFNIFPTGTPKYPETHNGKVHDQVPFLPSAYFEGNPPFHYGQANGTQESHYASILKSSTAPTNCEGYEYYQMGFVPTNTIGPWSASDYNGAYYQLDQNLSVLKNPPGDEYPTADNIPYIPYTARYEEVKAGNITHALDFALWVGAFCGCHVAPAIVSNTGYDGPAKDTIQLPWGARVRLKASYQDSTCDADGQTILVGLKKYGMYGRDTGGKYSNNNSIDTSVSIANPTGSSKIGAACVRNLRLSPADFDVIKLPSAPIQ